MNDEVRLDLVTPSRSMWLQFIKGFTPPSVLLMLFIPELFGPVLECLTLDWPAQDCPGFSCPRLHFWPPPWWIFLPQANSLVFEFKLWKVPEICWWLLQGGHLHIYHAVPPKVQISSAFCLLLVCFVGDVHIFRLLLPEHSLCPAFAEFCWLKLAEKARPATKSIYTAFVATTTTTAKLPGAKCLMLVSTFFWQVSICSVSGGIS